MALTLTAIACNNKNCSQLCITDTTGAYTSGNTGGFNAPNPTIASALTATIIISKRNSDGTFGTAYTTQNAYPTLPNTTSVQFCFTAEDCGLGTDSTFTDGVYKIVYTVTGNDGSPYTATTTFYKAIICGVKCCYDKMADEWSNCHCGCTDLDNEFMLIATWYRLLLAAIQCGNADAIQIYINKLNKVCGTCGGCGC